MKRALITGITGQDGAYLARFLLDKGYEVFGTYRRLSTPNFWRLQHLGVFDRVKLVSADLLDTPSLSEALRLSSPHEVYHLAAQSFVGASFDQPVGTGSITGLGVTRMLEAVRKDTPDTRFYQASTSELYGIGTESNNGFNESSPFRPASPYAAAKLYGHWITSIYRTGYGMFACNGILFNHESPLRGLEFVTRKITNTVARIALGLCKSLTLGNLKAQRDWGYAPEYVEAMWMMLQMDEPTDLAIATGESHSVEDFAEYAFECAGLDWREYVSTDARFTRPLDVQFLRGDSSQARRVLGWKPRTSFKELVKIMVDADLDRWQKWQNGERFPWDAFNYPNEDGIVCARGG